MSRLLILRRGLLLLALAALAAAPAGCAALRDALALQRPTARITGVSLQDVGLEAATLLFDVEVANPLSVPLPLVNLDYALASRDVPFLSGKADLAGTVPAGGTKTLSLPARVAYLKLLEVLKDVRPGAVVPYDAQLGLSVDVPAAGALRLPLKKSGSLPVPVAPTIDIAEIAWTGVSLDQAAGRVKLHVVNRNQFPVELSRFAYALALGGVDVADASIAQAVPFDAATGAATVEIPIAFSPRKAGLAVLDLILGKGAAYRLKGTMDLTTPYGAMSLPVERAAETLFRR